MAVGVGKESDCVEVLRANEALMGIEKKPCGFRVEQALGKMGWGRLLESGFLPPLDPGCFCPPRLLQRFNPLSQQRAGG